ncbi:CBP80/20-dependent translation initiation factor-like [Diretmus argenteus]
MENSSVASASSEAGSSRSQEIEELERFIDSYVLEYQVQGLLGDKADGDLDLDNGGKMPQWTEDCNDKKDGSRSSRGRGSSKPDEWEHSSNGSTGSRPSSGSRPGSGSRSGSRGRNNQFKGPAKNGNRDGSLDILGTDIWAANTMDSHGGAGWDVQPEKLDFSQFHRKHYRGTPKHLPQIDREGVNKIKFEEDDGIDMNDIERFLPHLHSEPPKEGERPRVFIFCCLRFPTRQDTICEARKHPPSVDNRVLRFTADFSNYTAKHGRGFTQVMASAHPAGTSYPPLHFTCGGGVFPGTQQRGTCCRESRDGIFTGGYNGSPGRSLSLSWQDYPAEACKV